MNITVNDVYKVGCLIFEVQQSTFHTLNKQAHMNRDKCQEIMMRLYHKGVVTLQYKLAGKEPIPYALIDSSHISQINRKYRPILFVEPAFKDEKEFHDRLDRAL